MRAKRPPLVEMRQWLEDYEQGKPEIKIARQSRRDVRTVKKGIDRARRDRDLHAARTEMLKETLLRHQDRLLDQLEKVLSADLSAVPPNSSEAWAGRRWGPDSGVSAASQARPLEVLRAFEETREWELLKEHLKREKLWKEIEDWKKAVASHEGEKTAMAQKAVALLLEKTGYPVREMERDRGGSTPVLYLSEAGPRLCLAAMERATYGPSAYDLVGSFHMGDAPGRVSFVHVPLARAPGKEEECRRKLLEAFAALEESSEVGSVTGSYQKAEEDLAKARRAVEDAVLLGMIPGQCSVCRRLGL